MQANSWPTGLDDIPYYWILVCESIKTFHLIYILPFQSLFNLKEEHLYYILDSLQCWTLTEQILKIFTWKFCVNCFLLLVVWCCVMPHFLSYNSGERRVLMKISQILVKSDMSQFWDEPSWPTRLTCMTGNTVKLTSFHSFKLFSAFSHFNLQTVQTKDIV